jgi:hypothetical protein
MKSVLLFSRKLSFLKDFLNNKMTHHHRYLGPVQSKKKFTVCFVIEENSNVFEEFDYQHFNESTKNATILSDFGSLLFRNAHLLPEWSALLYDWVEKAVCQLEVIYFP